MPSLERVEVFRGKHADADLFGPLPGFKDGDVVAYEFELPERFEPWPGRSRVERTFVLLDVGVSFANPCWFCCTNADGSVTVGDLNAQTVNAPSRVSGSGAERAAVSRGQSQVSACPGGCP